jgi:alcohol dehydrogenase (cytochrome c)
MSFRSTALFLATLVGSISVAAQVPYERLVRTDSEPHNWLHYSGNYASHRFSALDQIHRGNASRLKVAWVFQSRQPGPVEVTPLVVDGVMYTTEPLGSVVALDVRTGRSLWRWSRPVSKALHIGFPRVNRGVAILDETVYIGTLDAWLFALDARSGAERWSTHVADNATGHAITAAPLAIDGKILVGISGGEAGIRGFVDAFDAKTGELAWRFWTIPGPGEPGHDTWGGDSWKTGAAATWLTGSYDPELNLVYWGLGNPGPDWNGDARPGDNLYSCSIVALDAETGELQWHFQNTPHDVHDWDSNQIVMLADIEFDGRLRKVIVNANRNAFYYVLDRETGEFLHASSYAKQTWAEAIDENGRPIVLPNTSPTEEGNLVWPSLQGATNWYSPTYDPGRQIVVVPVREMGAYYYKSDVDYEPGKAFTGGGQRALSGDQAYGAVRALDVGTGELKWEFRLKSPLRAGLMSTAGGLVFGGDNEGNLFALDSDTGEALWSLQTGGQSRTNPMSYAVDGNQFVAIATGSSLFVLGLPDGE